MKKTILLYVLIPVCIIFVIVKWIIPVVGWGADSEPVKANPIPIMQKWDEGQLKQFDRENRVGTRYTLGRLEVETLAMQRRETVRTTPLLRVLVSKEKLVQVGTGTNRLLALTVTIQNQSDDPIEISNKLGEYETNGKRTAVLHEKHPLVGTYRAGEERTGVLFVKTEQKELTAGHLDLLYQTQSGEKQLRVSLNQQKN
ncbi:hypothetical protein [Exiguobacterium artemiae]